MHSDAKKKGFNQYWIVTILKQVLFLAISVALSISFYEFWINLRGIDSWSDINNYVQKFQGEYYYFSTLGYSDIELLTNEILWIWLVDLLIGLNFYIYDILKYTSIFCTISILIYLISSIKNWLILTLSLTIFLHPRLIDLIIGQNRSALAAALLYLALSTKKMPLVILASGVAAFIHTMFALLFLLFLVIYLYNKFLNNKLIYLEKYASTIIAFVLALIIKFFQSQILSSLGDRRAINILVQNSLGEMIAWIAIAVTFLVFRNWGKKSLESDMFIFCLGMMIISNFDGTYASRYIAICIPAYVVATINVGGGYRWISQGLFLFSTLVFLFAFWL